MDDSDIPLVEDAAPSPDLALPPPRTKIVFADSSDDEAPSGEPQRVAVVEPLYMLTTNAEDLEAGSSDVDEELDDNAADAAEVEEGSEGGGFPLQQPPLFLGADALSRYRGGLGSMGAVLSGSQRRRQPRQLGRVADRPVTDETFLEGKRKRFEDDDDGNAEGPTAAPQREERLDDSTAATAAITTVPGPAPIYRLTLVEADVQEVFSEADDADDEDGARNRAAKQVSGGDGLTPLTAAAEEVADQVLDGLDDDNLDDVEDLDDEEEEERFDRVVAVAAIAEAARVCEEDAEFSGDKRYQTFAAKARDLLAKLDAEEISDIAFLEAIEPEMLHLKRLHQRMHRPPKPEPIVVDGVLTDL